MYRLKKCPHFKGIFVHICVVGTMSGTLIKGDVLISGVSCSTVVEATAGTYVFAYHKGHCSRLDTGKVRGNNWLSCIAVFGTSGHSCSD